LVESISVTAQSTARFAFTLFNFDCRGNIFVTNEVSGNFRIWDSFRQFRCASKSNVYIFFNLSFPYVVSATQSLTAISENETFSIAPGEDRPFGGASLAVFEFLPCSAAVDIALQSNYTQTDPIISRTIPDPLLPDYQVPNIIPPAAVTEASGPSVLFGFGLSMAMALVIAAGLFARSVVRDRRAGRRPWKKPSAPQPPGPPPESIDPEMSDPDYAPSQCEIDVDLDEPVVVSDSDVFVPVEESQALPESPYDTEPGFC
jgi:hypothetical protein